jgi:uncharacterized protein YndB with AHSA1/START domain
MSTQRTAGGSTGQNLELRISRTLNAPRHVVFEAWANPERARRWWGPRGFRTTIQQWDVRPGGHWRATMRSPDGKEHPQRGVFHEIVPPERTVYTFKWVNESDPESIVTVDFADLGERTEMTFRQQEFKSAESRDSHEAGWNEAFDRLTEELAKGRGNH